MRFSSSFCVLFFTVMIFLSVVSDERWAKYEYRWHECSSGSTYEDGSTYSANLNRVMDDLFRNTPQSSGFNTTSSGETPNKVYGLMQCIGNVSTEICSYCAQQAFFCIVNGSKEKCSDCTHDMGGLVLTNDCFLRYDTDFFSNLDTKLYIALFSINNISGNMDDFKATTSGLLSDLSNLASNSDKRYAIGSTNYSTSKCVYGLAQCWRYLSSEDCKTCLDKIWNKDVEGDSRYGTEGAQAMSRSCTVRYEIYPFFDTTKASPPTPTRGKSSKALPIIVGVIGSLILALVICVIAMRKRVRSAIFGRRVTVVTHNEEMDADSSEFGLLIQDQQHFIMKLEALAGATENFHENIKLGEGGFGSVYKGTTRDGEEIAVKRLSTRSSQGKKEFMNEVKLMGNVQHRNLVKLLGCCAEGDERLLVYEYFSNKSLDTFLFHPEKHRQLDWPKRYNIIIGIIRGLLYLHEDSQLRIIHRDIKVNNILLDDKLNPKIADFGLARLFPEDKTQIQTRVAGTYCYMAPEYAMRGQLSVKADIYSFGVLLLEIVSGRKNTDVDLPHEMQNLLEWAWRLYRGGDVMSIAESNVRESWPKERVERCIHVALLCVQADATDRPTMSNVIMMISSNASALPNRTKPPFVSSSESSAGLGVEMSVNETSVTDVGSR